MNHTSQDAYTQAYNKWVVNQTPENMAELVSEFMPTINSELQQYSGPKELLRSRAKSFVVQAIRSYNPLGNTKLNSWVVTNLKQLSRYGKRLRPIRASEEMIRNASELNSVTKELEDKLGRLPTDDELQDETGWSKKTIEKLRATSVASVNSGSYDVTDAEETTNDPAVSKLNNIPFLQDAVYMSLNDRDRKIFDYRLGQHGHKAISGESTAKKLHVTPAYVSQRAATIGKSISELGSR